MPQKAKTKPTSSSSSSLHKFSSSTVTATTVSASSPEKQSQPSAQQQQPSVQQSNFEDWVGDEDEYYFQDSRPKAERGGRKKKKKGNKAQERVWDWDDIYDPTLPNTYADYKGSEEQAREIRDWKARLYYRQLKEARKAGKNGAAYSDEEEESRPRPMNSKCRRRILLDTADLCVQACLRRHRRLALHHLALTETRDQLALKKTTTMEVTTVHPMHCLATIENDHPTTLRQCSRRRQYRTTPVVRTLICAACG